MARLATGSIQVSPVPQMTMPATTTAADTTASAAMCRNAPRTLTSPLRPLANSQAVRPLTAMPIAATIDTVSPGTGGGAAIRSPASITIAPSATSSNSALNSAARIVDPFSP